VEGGEPDDVGHVLQVMTRSGKRRYEHRMPHFYFDVDDGERLTRDEDGLVLADLAAACRQAVNALPDVAREVLPDGTEKVISTSVRDAAGTTLFRAQLVFSCEWPAR
jgi:hypothetical protein